MQEPIVFELDGQKLFGMLHTPKAAGRPAPGVLLCHGFTGSRVEAHFLFVKAARALAEAGMAALRFDFRGSGESEGAFRDVSVSTEIDDAADALDVLAADERVDAGRLGVLGLSLGGCVAACLAGRDARVRSVVLWSAVARPHAIADEPPRESWGVLVRRHGHLDIGGFDVGLAFIEDLANHDPVADLAASGATTLIVHGSADTSVDAAETDLYFEALSERGTRVEKHIVPDGNHTFGQVKWEREVIDRSVDWLAETLREPSPVRGQPT